MFSREILVSRSSCSIWSCCEGVVAMAEVAQVQAWRRRQLLPPAGLDPDLRHPSWPQHPDFIFILILRRAQCRTNRSHHERLIWLGSDLIGLV